MNINRIKELLWEVRKAQPSMLGFWNGKAGGFIEATTAPALAKVALYDLLMNAHAIRCEELREAEKTPAFIRDQAA